MEDRLFLAIAARRLDRSDEARRRLDQARAEIEKSQIKLKPTERQRYAGLWELRVTQAMLLNEAERLIELDDRATNATPPK